MVYLGIEPWDFYAAVPKVVTGKNRIAAIVPVQNPIILIHLLLLSLLLLCNASCRVSRFIFRGSGVGGDLKASRKHLKFEHRR